LLAAAFEMAVSDAELRAEGRSLAASLGIGPGFETMPAGAVVGIPDPRDVDALLVDVGRAVGGGSSRSA